ncbi:hypothetical protein ACSV5M_01000 [Cellvibrio sp. ARAG 10.3]|uniref:hypothetical protein n=1 Tax=Cellvibrio sp. ARAG 10.3 TaxID=3451358 RepID=UPI003F47E6D9
MKLNDIRVFIPSKDYETSQSFYRALGFTLSKASDDLSILEKDNTTFFLQRYYNKEFAENLMLQLVVEDIEAAYKAVSGIEVGNYNARFSPIKQESWGKVIYLWGPSGELWHITELKP